MTPVLRWTSLADVPPGYGPSVVTLGNFDGVHRGHRAVLTQVHRLAAARGALAVAVTFVGEPKLSAKSEAALFRIFQEAMNNAAKHARARFVFVTLGRTDGNAERGCGFVEVRDDGQGFDPEAVTDRVTSAGGLGLKQMRERVEGLGGRFEVVSQPGAGTRVYAAVPE